MFYLFAIATLILGLIAGFLFQRSGQCFIGAYRDFYLFRDTHLLKGVIGFFVGALIGYILLYLVGDAVVSGTFPWVVSKGVNAIPGSIVPTKDLAVIYALALAAGIGIGFFSIAAGGCPMRNHVMAAEGNRSSIAYVIGFWVGIPIIYTIIHFLFL